MSVCIKYRTTFVNPTNYVERNPIDDNILTLNNQYNATMTCPKCGRVYEKIG